MNCARPARAAPPAWRQLPASRRLCLGQSRLKRCTGTRTCPGSCCSSLCARWLLSGRRKLHGTGVMGGRVGGAACPRCPLPVWGSGLWGVERGQCAGPQGSRGGFDFRCSHLQTSASDRADSGTMSPANASSASALKPRMAGLPAAGSESPRWRVQPMHPCTARPMARPALLGVPRPMGVRMLYLPGIGILNIPNTGLQ